MIIHAVLSMFFALGFAYLLWVFAAKEKGGLSLLGKIISIALIAFSLISFGSQLVFCSHGPHRGPGMMCKEARFNREMPEDVKNVKQATQQNQNKDLKKIPEVTAKKTR